VIAEARDAGLSGVALDVAHGNDGAIRFYHRLGFLSVSDHHVPAMRGRPAIGSVRMELSLDR
jgi:ribosomal protein S18 acetylase RimI-like enzyme